MNNETTKDRIIRKGAELVYFKGFNNTGIQEILKAAEVPKGSFYFYFKNKEEFGLSLIDYFSSSIKNIAQNQIQAGADDPIGGLRNFFVLFIGMMKKMNYTCGCPVGNMAQEMSDLSEPFRDRIKAVFSELKGMIRECIIKAKESGRLGNDIDPGQFSEFIFNSWEGALIEMKVSKGARSLDVFMDMVFGVLLQ